MYRLASWLDYEGNIVGIKVVDVFGRPSVCSIDIFKGHKLDKSMLRGSVEKLIYDRRVFLTPLEVKTNKHYQDITENKLEVKRVLKSLMQPKQGDKKVIGGIVLSNICSYKGIRDKARGLSKSDVNESLNERSVVSSKELIVSHIIQCMGGFKWVKSTSKLDNANTYYLDSDNCELYKSFKSYIKLAIAEVAKETGYFIEVDIEAYSPMLNIKVKVTDPYIGVV